MDPDFSSCPWHQSLHKAAYATQALVSFLDQKQGFASPLVRTIFQYRSGFSLKLPSSSFEDQQLELSQAHWLSAVLAKIAQRGLPAPCSLSIEQHVLKCAQSVDLLDYRADISGGAYHFRLNPGLAFKENFKPLIYAALYPELCVDDAELEPLIQHYLSLATALEQELFNQLRSRFRDPRLALFVIPQRRMEQILAKVSQTTRDMQRTDFSIEVPSPYRNYCLRLVIEADDPRHLEAAQQQIDRNRDQKLINAGWQVKRLHLSAFNQWSEHLDRIAELLHSVITPDLQDAACQLRSLPPEQRTALQNLVVLPVIEAQLLVASAHFIREYGSARMAVSDPLNIGLTPVVEAVNETLHSLLDLADLRNVGEAYLVEEDAAEAHLSLFPTPTATQWRLYSLQQGALGPCIVRHEHIASLWPAQPQPLFVNPDVARQQSALDHLLANLFRKVQFREGQLPILIRALSLRPVVGLLPTGAGKSLCYQFASLLQPGFSLVIDPLRSLMQDQQNSLQEMGIHRCQALINSGDQDIQTLQKPMSDGQYWFIFISPERLQVKSFRTVLSTIIYLFPVVYVIIDEAHCVSEWGHDFRPSYLNVGQRISKYCKHDRVQPSIIALTGTASRNVLTDILKELQIDDQTAIFEPKSFDRKELQFEVIRVNNSSRIPNLAGKLNALFHQANRGLKSQQISGLVFTYFRKSVSVSVQNIASELQFQLQSQAVCGYDGTEEEMRAIQKQFKLDNIPVLVCTHGFGMGIDKPNVRFVVHAMLPRSLEDYYQQAGRAGRDQSPAQCTIFFVDEDEQRSRQLLSTEITPIENIHHIIRQIPHWTSSDLVRNFWFITNSFIGREIEKKIFIHVISQINFSKKSQRIALSFPKDVQKKYSEKLNFEKALYRLSLLGIIKDYTMDGAIENPQFQLEIETSITQQTVYQKLNSYIRQYLLENDVLKFLPSPLPDNFSTALIQCGEKLIDFVYDFIEKRRRTALGTMLQVARVGADQGPEEFRRQLLAFLEESEFTEPVRFLSSRVDYMEWFSLLEKVRGTDDITNLLGACRRQLQETPDHPGLLLLVGLCSLNSPYLEDGRRFIALSFGRLHKQFREIDRIEIAKKLQMISKRFFRDSPEKQSIVLSGILIGDTSLGLLDFCYREAEPFSEAHHIAIRLIATRILQATKAF